MKYTKLTDLKTFLTKCEEVILENKNRKPVIYPSDAIVSWDSDTIKRVNEELLKSISGSANVYVIFSADKGNNEYSLKYIGQTKSKRARTRLTNHLINKHKETGAQLSKVIDHIKAGGNIKISWVSIEPESLRHYVEEELITKHKEKLDWNRHGKKRRSRENLNGKTSLK